MISVSQPRLSVINFFERLPQRVTYSTSSTTFISGRIRCVFLVKRKKKYEKKLQHS